MKEEQQRVKSSRREIQEMSGLRQRAALSSAHVEGRVRVIGSLASL